METINVDIDPLQLLRWILTERRMGQSDLRVTALRSYELFPVTRDSGPPLGDQDQQEIAEGILRGSLQITPEDPHGGWVIRLDTEDEIGPHLPDDESAPDAPEEIDVEAFAEEIVFPNRARMEVTAKARDAVARSHLEAVLHEIEVDRHEAG